MSMAGVLKPIIYTSLALIAFAGNSVLCRLALDEQAMDPVGFTSIRLLAGALALYCMHMLLCLNATTSKSKSVIKGHGSLWAAIMLFVYAICFSYAYITLETGIGALILFASVQISMITMSVLRGSKLMLVEWAGLGLAFYGLVYLLLPQLTTPTFLGFVLMAMAGMAWAGYTLCGQGSQNPLADTTSNFMRTLPLVVGLLVWGFKDVQYTEAGILLAVISGVLTSGLGYALWYLALRYLTTLQAAVLQLLVPVIAALGGVTFANEVISWHLTLSALMILGGILLVIMAKLPSLKTIKGR